ncbi:hypothetical protein L1887_55101 [Cichorium endivia]|nr:hypothetical protein L1887_55101 [Cichorium endivia]
MPRTAHTFMLRSSMVNPDADQCVCMSEEQVSQGYQQRRMPSSSLAGTDAGLQLSGDLTPLKFCRGSLLCRHSDMRGRPAKGSELRTSELSSRTYSPTSSRRFFCTSSVRIVTSERPQPSAERTSTQQRSGCAVGHARHHLHLPTRLPDELGWRRDVSADGTTARSRADCTRPIAGATPCRLL